MLKKLKPLMYNNSKVPVWLSHLAPINIWAISLGIFVFCRGEMSDTTRRHETIHFQQQLELLFVFQWILYGLFYLIQLIRLKNKKFAYYENPFEREAFGNEEQVDYLENRPRYAWLKYLRD